jgi:hypothetical protein
MDGTAVKAKTEGVYKGRKPTIELENIRRLLEAVKCIPVVDKKTGISRASGYCAFAVRKN